MDEMAVLDSMITRNGIKMQIEKVSRNPNLDAGQSDELLEHYRCRLLKPGKQMDVYVSINTADGLLTTSDVLFMLAMDAFGCRMLEGYDDLREQLSHIFAGSDGNLEEIEGFWEEYGGRCRQTQQLKEFLGEGIYDEVLRQFDPRQGMPDFSGQIQF
jgi:hypothetical protein